MVRHNIEAILIMDRNGMPRFFMQLDPRSKEMDPMLASSFFAAIDMFSKEVLETRVPKFNIDYGARVFTVITGVQTNLIAISYGPILPEIPQILTSLLAEFELEWLASAAPHDLDSSFVEIYLQAFGERVMQKLAFQELPGKWVPYFLPGIILGDAHRNAVTDLIDGTRTIERIKIEGGVTEKALLLEMSKLWAFRAIRFKNMLGPGDYISVRSRYIEYQRSSSQDYKALKNHYPRLLPIIPRIRGFIDGRRSVGDIIHLLRDQFDETDIYKALDYLMDKDAILVLGPEMRRILLAKEVLEVLLRISEQVYSHLEAGAAIKSVLNKTASPEVVGQIRYFAKRWTIDFHPDVYINLPINKMMLVYGEWTKLVAQYIEAFDSRKLEVFIERIISSFTTFLFDRYTSLDFRGMEEFSFWLELLTIDKWHRPITTRAGSIADSGRKTALDLAYILLLRGKSIYGEERIKDICTASGIAFGNDLSAKWMEQYSEQTLETFIINYSKLGPASRLSILILAKQRGIQVPEVLRSKKNGSRKII
ncbi:MAG: hypothetical protein GF411_19530 [Candidatus Lokiarchaeota archaeon]|nr:hypothetical protein [Candidatus Lokiarchaeota archaeon]